MNLLYTIGHRGTNPFRVGNLLKVISWVSKFPVRLVIVEQDDTPKIKDMLKDYKLDYIFAYNKGLYNRSWAFNVVHNSFDYDYMICADNDMVMRFNDFSNFLSSCSSYDAVSPFNRLIDLDENESKDFNPETYVVRKGPRGWMNFTSGICAISKPTMIRVGGWDERFEGWGGEDNAMTRQLSLLNLKMSQLNNECFHFFHPRGGGDGSPDHGKYGSNISFLREHEENRYNLKDISTKGNINKYR